MKNTVPMTSAILVCFLLLFKGQCCWCQCSKDEYRRCTLLADPLLKDPHLIYPDNLKDIEHVCRSWSQFVDCVKRYTDLCFTEAKRREFNKAVESPVELVHHMCTSTEYQGEYMKHSRCMRAILTEDIHCGRHYRQLVSQVSGEPATPALCCSHHRFRECVLDQTSRSCEVDAPTFAKQILDKALSFLRDQCANYQPDQIDCPGSDFYSSGGTARITSKWIEPTKVAVAGVYWNNNQDDRRSTGRKLDYTSPELSSPNTPMYGTEPNNQESRTGSGRSTFGVRGMSWDQSLSSTEPSPADSSWKITSGGAISTENGWFPSSSPSSISGKSTISATNTAINNQIDEPNQQGLSNRNVATKKDLSINLMFVIVSTTIILLRYSS